VVIMMEILKMYPHLKGSVSSNYRETCQWPDLKTTALHHLAS